METSVLKKELNDTRKELLKELDTLTAAIERATLRADFFNKEAKEVKSLSNLAELSLETVDTLKKAIHVCEESIESLDKIMAVAEETEPMRR